MTLKYSTEIYKNVTIFCYSSNISSEATLIDDEAWLVVPKSWAEMQLQKQGFSDYESFLKNGTFDDTEGWYEKAIDDGVLLGYGLGHMNDSTVWRLSEEDFKAILSQQEITLSAEEEHRFLTAARESFSIADWSDWVHAFIHSRLKS